MEKIVLFVEAIHIAINALMDIIVKMVNVFSVAKIAYNALNK